MGTITINGKNYSGRNVSVIDGKVFIDGKESEPISDKIINIAIHGDITELKCDVCEKIGVIGNVGGIKTASANVEVRGNITGSVETMSGNVKAQSISGSVKTMSGNIN